MALGSVPGDQAPGLISGEGQAPGLGQQGNLGKPISKGYRSHPRGTPSEGEP